MSILRTALFVASLALTYTVGPSNVSSQEAPNETMEILTRCLKTPPPPDCLPVRGRRIAEGETIGAPPPPPSATFGVHDRQNMRTYSDIPESTFVVPRNEMLRNFDPSDFNIENFPHRMQVY